MNHIQRRLTELALKTLLCLCLPGYLESTMLMVCHVSDCLDARHSVMLFNPVISSVFQSHLLFNPVISSPGNPLKSLKFQV